MRIENYIIIYTNNRSNSGISAFKLAEKKKVGEL